ncbi:MAG: CoB--CoM heterodisulfide reductase iron-sulfur subunit A family protein [Anaerolineae bacterium]|nr:CoB--CoM heterodisulfide reductase iron-sulfur subunit A family protein [Anaerolineae bacterium]
MQTSPLPPPGRPGAAAVVIGGGFAGMAAAQRLLRAGVETHIVERAPTLGGLPAWLGFMFPTGACLLCRSGDDHGSGCPRPAIGPEFNALCPHSLLHVHTGCQALAIEGEYPAFRVSVRRVEGDSLRGTPAQLLSRGPLDEGPLPPGFGPSAAVAGKSAGPAEFTLEAGAVILATGGALFDASRAGEFGYGRFPGVLTGLDFERMVSRNGPMEGQIVGPQGQRPRRIAWFQCVGSRDEDRDYCSAFCCMYATKQAVLAKQSDPEVECKVFMMDDRVFAEGFASRYAQAREQYGIAYERCRPSSLKRDARTGELYFRYVNNRDELVTERFDMVVLSVGLEPATDALALLGSSTAEVPFLPGTSAFRPGETSRPGVFACGGASGPKDMADATAEAAAAAALAIASLQQAAPAPPPAVPVREGSEGVAVIVASSSADDASDGPSALARVAQAWPEVKAATCLPLPRTAADRSALARWMATTGASGVVVAAGSARTDRRAFEAALAEAGLGWQSLEYVALPTDSEWTGKGSRSVALLRAAVTRASTLKPQEPAAPAVCPTTLVVGGGASGLVAALHLADGGRPVVLVEQEEEIGGNLARVPESLTGEDLAAELEVLMGKARRHPNLRLLTSSRVRRTRGTFGRFRSTLETPEGTETLEHGALIVATGAIEHRGTAYGLGSSGRILTLLDLEARLKADSTCLEDVGTAVFVSCVGPWDEDSSLAWRCSRTCCDGILRNALRLKRANPSATVHVLVRETMTVGTRERYYTEARRQGVTFTRFTPDRRPRVEVSGSDVSVSWYDPALREPIITAADLVVLAEAIVPRPQSASLAERLPLDGLDVDGFFASKEAKVAPFSTSRRGVFVIGLAQGPKPLELSVAQGLGAAQDVLNLLASPARPPWHRVAQVAPEKCVACLTCVRVCPYGVPDVDAAAVGVGGIAGAAWINPLACEGCGACVAECPQDAITLAGYDTAAVSAGEAAYYRALQEVS